MTKHVHIKGAILNFCMEAVESFVVGWLPRIQCVIQCTGTKYEGS